MAKVGIVMGSDSDMPIMAKAADVLKELGIDFDMTIISAHREPEEWQHIFQECVPQSSQCQLLVFQ